MWQELLLRELAHLFLQTEILMKNFILMKNKRWKELNLQKKYLKIETVNEKKEQFSMIINNLELTTTTHRPTTLLKHTDEASCFA